MVQVFVTTELLSDEPRASSSGEAAAHHDDTRESLQFGKRTEESARIEQPTACGARPRQTMVVEEDQDGTSILEQLC
jgi:hypothetical protein